MKYMFDSCSFDEILKSNSYKLIEESHKQGYEYYITSIQVEELCRVPDEEKRVSLILNMSSMRPKIVPIASFVLGYARLGYARLGDGVIYEQILNENRSNIKDALIAETAIIEKCKLVTEDNGLINIMEKNNFTTIKFEDFMETLK